jgi:hypothetical protein
MKRQLYTILTLLLTVLPIQMNADNFVIVQNGNEQTVEGKIQVVEGNEYIVVGNTPYKVIGTNTALIGDVDSSGTVEVSDVTAIVDIILGNRTDFSILLANVNEDAENTIGVDDVTLLVDIILGNAQAKSVVVSYDVQEVTDFVWIVGGVGSNTDKAVEQE